MLPEDDKTKPVDKCLIIKIDYHVYYKTSRKLPEILLPFKMRQGQNFIFKNVFIEF